MREKKNVSKLTMFLVIDAVIVLGLIFMINKYVENKVGEVEVYRFLETVAPGIQIKEHHVEVVKIPEKGVNDGVILASEQPVVGLFANEKIYKGDYASENRLVKDNQADPLAFVDEKEIGKLRKIAIPADILSTFGGDISKGERIDLMFTGTTKEGEQVSYSKVFMQNVLVYDVLSSGGASYIKPKDRAPVEIDPENPEAAELAEAEMNLRKDIAMVILAVTIEQYEEIVARQKVGTVSIVGRFDRSESYETRGFATGEILTPVKLGSTKVEVKGTEIIQNQKTESSDW